MHSGISDLVTSVRAAAVRQDVQNAVAAIYAELDARIAVRKPICVSSGRCCHFDEFGHRLYITTLELARFVSDLSEGHSANQKDQQVTPHDRFENRRSLPVLPVAPEKSDGRCPFQVGKLCGVHGIRPFGCRIFFCDATSTQFQHDLYAELHDRFRRLHEELQVPYFYIEWRYALQTMGLQSVSGAGR